MTHEEFESIAARDAIGAATPEEVSALRAHSESCPDCRKARDEHQPEPPPPEQRSGVNPWWLATAATLFLALWGWRELGIRAAREKIRTQEAEIRSVTEEKERLAEQNRKFATMVAPETRIMALTGREMSPSASARAFIDPTRHRAIVFFNNMPANPPDKSYQLWVIRSDQPKPQSAGVFDVAQNGSATITVENLPPMNVTKALAVTMESRGGVESPTSAKCYVMGGTS